MKLDDFLTLSFLLGPRLSLLTVAAYYVGGALLLIGFVVAALVL